MSISAIRALIMLANLALLGLIGWFCYATFITVDEEKYFVEPPNFEKIRVPEVVDDPAQQNKQLYKAITRVLDRPPPEPPPPPPPSAPIEPPKPDPRGIQVVLIVYCKEQEKASALLVAPLARSQEPRFFQVGLDLGAPGLGFEQYAGCKIKEVQEYDVIFLDQKGLEVKVPGPRPRS